MSFWSGPTAGMAVCLTWCAFWSFVELHVNARCIIRTTLLACSWMCIKTAMSVCAHVLCRRAWRVSQGCIDIDLPEAKLEVELDQLDAATPHITCTKLSQVCMYMLRVLLVVLVTTDGLQQWWGVWWLSSLEASTWWRPPSAAARLVANKPCGICIHTEQTAH